MCQNVSSTVGITRRKGLLDRGRCFCRNHMYEIRCVYTACMPHASFRYVHTCIYIHGIHTSWYVFSPSYSYVFTVYIYMNTVFCWLCTFKLQPTNTYIVDLKRRYLLRTRRPNERGMTPIDTALEVASRIRHGISYPREWLVDGWMLMPWENVPQIVSISPTYIYIHTYIHTYTHTYIHTYIHFSNEVNPSNKPFQIRFDWV